jgi:hypothetical protein
MYLRKKEQAHCQLAVVDLHSKFAAIMWCVGGGEGEQLLFFKE